MSYIARGEVKKHERELIGTYLNIHFMTAPREKISPYFSFLFASRENLLLPRTQKKVNSRAYD